MSEGTRIVRLRPEVARDELTNGTTRIALPDRELLNPTAPRELFEAHQSEMHRVVSSSGPGVAVFALSQARGIEGHLWLNAPERGVRAGSVGRHSAADLCLPADDTLALRHLAVFVRRIEGRVVTRVVDLRTHHAFYDEHRKMHHAVESDGLMVLGAASYWIFVVPTGGPPPWKPTAADPWKSLPRRIVTELAADPAPKYVRLSRRASSDEVTYVTPFRAPVDTAMEALVVENEHAVAHLVVTRDGGRPVRVPVGRTALTRGILLGRYSRCDDRELFDDDRVSRVHGIIVDFDGETWLFDLGSTNGTSEDGIHDLRARELIHGTSLRIANAVTIRWEVPS